MMSAKTLRPYVIAEGGVNHNGEIDLAFKLVDAAFDAGADAIKFQHFRPELLTRPDAEMASYQRQNIQRDQSQMEMLAELNMSADALEKIAAYAIKKGIAFLCTPFDARSAEEIADLVPAWKVSSTDLTNFPFLRTLSSFNKPLLLSSGMATYDEVEAAAAFCKPLTSPNDRFPPVTILHCVSAYPAPLAETNLLVIPELRRRLGIAIGFSDHSLGLGASIGAAALGATVIEKHMTLDVTMPGPDHRASLEPDQFHQLVTAIHDVWSARGSSEKAPQESEQEHRQTVRRSLHAARDIAAGSIIESRDLIALRPADGLSPMEFDSVVGMKTLNAITEGQPILRTDLADNLDESGTGHVSR